MFVGEDLAKAGPSPTCDPFRTERARPPRPTYRHPAPARVCARIPTENGGAETPIASKRSNRQETKMDIIQQLEK